MYHNMHKPVKNIPHVAFTGSSESFCMLHLLPGFLVQKASRIMVHHAVPAGNPLQMQHTLYFLPFHMGGTQPMFDGLMNSHITIALYIEFFIRIVLACLCGALIGLERSRRLKEAGVRTHLLVACSAALMMIISKYGFTDLVDSDSVTFLGDRAADPARIAAQVVSGIGFLCAGVIFKQGSVVKGLTTAAGMWATTGVGLSFGAGMYYLGVFSTILIIFLQYLTHRLRIVNDQYQNNHIDIIVKDENHTFHRALTQQLKVWQAQVEESRITHNQDGTTSYSMLVKMSADVKQEELFSFFAENGSVITFSRTIHG